MTSPAIKTLPLVVLMLLGLLLFIPVNYLFILAVPYFLGNLLLVWAFRNWRLIPWPVPNGQKLAFLIILAPLLYMFYRFWFTTQHFQGDEMVRSLMRNGLMLGVVVLQYVILVYSFKKPTVDRY